MTSSRTRSTFLLALAAASALVPVACSATVKRSTGEFSAGSTSTSTSTASLGQGGAASSGSGQGGGIGSFVGTGLGDSGPGCAVHCSADLHQIIDCNGAVVQTCDPTTGCGQNGTCVSPCDAAAANQSTFGCDFWSLPPSPETETSGSCFAALISNTWNAPVTLTADYAGMPLDISGLARVPSGSGSSLSYAPLTNGQLAPGQVAILFLSQGPGGESLFVPCPAGVTPGISTDPAVLGTAVIDAFHFSASAPIVAYDIYPYGGAASEVSSATLLVPTPAWGTNYIAADAFAEDSALEPYGGSPFVQIVASMDNTHVTISPTAAIVGGTGVAGTGQGMPVTYALNRGQAVQFLQSDELAGSPISSDNPISVWGGSGCMHVPLGSAACDSGHQQLLPVSTLGFQYAAVRYHDRESGLNESVPWTIIGAVDGTTLTYDPAAPAGAPTTLMSGQMVRFDSSDAFTVSSQSNKYPFYFAGHMTGASMTTSAIGDPEYVNVVPPQQYLGHYLFLTDPTYGWTEVAFVRQKGPDGMFHDVTLDCVGTITGWQPIGSDAFEYAHVDLTVGGAAQGMCNNGVHTADSTVPFGLTVWGYDTYVSYAYPAGASTQPINSVVVPPVTQ